MFPRQVVQTREFDTVMLAVLHCKRLARLKSKLKTKNVQRLKSTMTLSKHSELTEHQLLDWMVQYLGAVSLDWIAHQTPVLVCTVSSFEFFGHCAGDTVPNLDLTKL